MPATFPGVVLKSFQEKIRLAARPIGPEGEDLSSSFELNQLVMELLGLSPAASRKVYGESQVPDSTNVELSPKKVRSYSSNLGISKRATKAARKEAEESGEEPEEKIKTIKELDDRVTLIEEVENISPVENCYFERFISKWRDQLSASQRSYSVTPYSLCWDQVASEPGPQFRCTGARNLYINLQKLLRSNPIGWQTVVFWTPLPTEPDILESKYTMQIFEPECGTNPEERDEATAALMAFLLLNDGAVNAKMVDIIKRTKLSDFFDTLAYMLGSKEGFYIFTKPGGADGSEEERVLFRPKSRERGMPFSAKKLYAGAEKQEQDIEYIATNMTFTAGQVNSALCVVRLPLKSPGDAGALCVYAPEFWSTMITSGKSTPRGEGLTAFFRGPYAKAILAGVDQEDIRPKYDYDFNPHTV